MNAQQRDAEAAKVAGKNMDKLVTSFKHVKRTEANVEYNPALLTSRTFLRYNVNKRSAHKIRKTLLARGFTASDSAPRVLSKSLTVEGSRRLAKVLVHPDHVVCKCYVGVPPAPF